MGRRIAILALVLSALAAPVAAETVSTGTDTFSTGPEAAAVEAPGDLFVSGNSITLRGGTGGDAHAAGLNVDVEAPVGGDLYAAGANVAVRAAVASDATLAGWDVRLDDDASVGGNARLAGGTVQVRAPVEGALTVMGADVTLDAAVGGDVRLVAETLAFGPDARIAGRLVYSAPTPVSIPPDVIPPDRVTFEESRVPEALREARRDWGEGPWPILPGILSALGGGLLFLLFLLLVGGLCLGLAPRLVEETRAVGEARPGRSLTLGIAGLSLLLGVVPVMAITLIGLPLVPVAILLAVVGWMLGWLLGLYVVVRRLRGGAGEGDSLTVRLVLLAVGLVIASLLNFVPFLGWAANVVLVLLGLGAMTSRLIDRLATRPEVAAAAPATVASSAPPPPPPL